MGIGLDCCAVERFPVGALTVVGRGLGLSAANECALKIREVSGVRAEAYAAPDLVHGPIGADGSGATMWLVLTEEIDDDTATDLLGRAKASGMTTVVSRLEARRGTSADLEMVLPVDCPNWVTPFLTIVLGQVFALRLGELRQRPIDQPAGVEKDNAHELSERDVLVAHDVTRQPQFVVEHKETRR